MLKNLDPILTPDLLWVLRAMGHGDDLVLSDANFPSQSVAGVKHLIRLPGIDIPTAARAILSVLPLDSFVTHSVLRMEVVGKPDELPLVQQQMQREIDRAEGKPLPMGSLERFAFYEAAKRAFAVVTTGDARGYGCFLLKKGVIMAVD